MQDAQWTTGVIMQVDGGALLTNGSMAIHAKLMKELTSNNQSQQKWLIFDAIEDITKVKSYFEALIASTLFWFKKLKFKYLLIRILNKSYSIYFREIDW